MMAKTHLFFSFSLGTLPITLQGIDTYETHVVQSYFLGLALGSLFPDIDEPNSTIGKRTAFIPHLIRLFTSHRGLTHSFLILVFWCILAAYSLSNFTVISDVINPGMLVLGFAIGNIFHVWGDAMTTGGIKHFFWPFSSFRLVALPDSMRFSVGSLKEYGWLIIFMLILGIQGIVWLQDLLGYRYAILEFLSGVLL